MSYFINHRHKLLIEILILITIAIYVSYFDPSVLRCKNDNMVGHMGSMTYIRPLDDILQGKVPYKDFYWEYGPFYLYIQLLPYIVFGMNHNALFVSWNSYLPFISIIISFLWAAIFFRNTFFRIFFVLICIFQNVNCVYPSIRHLIAELSIAIFILSIRKTEKKSSIFLAGLMSAAAILTAQEYGVASIITITIATLILYFIPHRISLRQRFGYYFLGVFAVLVPYYAYLALNGALISYFKYIYDFTRNFANPASGELFPVLPLIAFKNCLVFFKSLYDFLVSKNLRFYLPLIIYFLSFIYFIVKFIKFREKRALEIFALSFYGLIMFGRVLSGPAYGYLVYGFIPTITLGLLFVQYIQKLSIHYYFKHRIARALSLWIFLGCVYGWIFLTIENKEILNIPHNLNLKKRISEYREGKVYYDKVGYFVTPKTYEQYKMINDYIEKHTAINDYIFVYPWGPYNHFTKRPSPLTARHTYDFIAGEYYINEAVMQLDERKPRYVIINLYNNLGVVHMGGKRGDVGDSITWGTEDSLSFCGKGDKLQVYILENYELEKKFDYAAIMIRSNKKRIFKRNFSLAYLWQPKNNQIDYEVKGLKKTNEDYIFRVLNRDSYLEHRFNNSVLCSYVEVTFRVKNNIFRKILSKNFINIYLRTENSNEFNVRAGGGSDLMNSNRYQKIWIGFAGQILPINAFRISIVTPKPYILPSFIEIKEVKLLLEKS